jgi:hypothetical protein
VKVIEENMADVGGLSVTGIETESPTTVAVWRELYKMLLQNLNFMYFGNYDLSSVTNMNTQSVTLYCVFITCVTCLIWKDTA